MRRFTVLLALALAFAVASSLHARQARDPRAEVALQAAIKTETIDGDLKKAIDMYRALAARKDQPAVAAQALLRMGQCHEKLGDAEARKAYEQLLRDFAEQKEAAGQARIRLARLSGARSRTLGTRQVAIVSDWGPYGIQALSPDGRSLAFVDNLRGCVTMRNVGTGEEWRLARPPVVAGAAIGIAFSPDGRQVATTWVDMSEAAVAAFSSDKVRWALVVSGIDGTGPRVLWTGVGAAYPRVTWLADGKRLLIASTDLKLRNVALQLFPVSGGPPQTAGPSFDLQGLGALAPSPDGRFVAYAKHEEEQSGTSLMVRDLETGVDRRVADRARGGGEPTWTRDGKAVLYLDVHAGSGDLWMARVENGVPQGEPRLVKADLGDAVPIGIANDGTLYYRTRATMMADEVAEIDPATGKLAGTPRVLRPFRQGESCGHDWMPDGTAFVYASRATAGSSAGCTLLVVHPLDGGRERIVSTDLTALQHPRVSPDGSFALVYGTKGQQGYSTYRVDMTTGATAVAAEGYAEWSPDGKGIYVATVASDESWYRVVYRDLHTAAETERFRSAPPQAINIFFDDFAPSRDGVLSMIVVSDTSNGRQAIVAAPGDQTHAVFSTAGPDILTCIAWTADGQSLWVLRRKADRPSVRELLRAPINGGPPVSTGLVGDVDGLRAHPDGRRLLMTVGKSGSEIWALENFLPGA
jgi:Tol biopolymer transport system component